MPGGASATLDLHGHDLFGCPVAIATRWQQYQLTKPRVVQLIVFCAAIGMALAVPDCRAAPRP